MNDVHGWRRIVAVLAGAVIVVLAAAGVAAAAGENRTASASKTAGLDPNGETVTVTGSGFDEAKGIYVAFCVDNGAGQVATPCLGGVDTSGGTGSSHWISSNPPAYGEGLATPYGPDGSFQVSLQVAAADQFVDCQDPASAPNGCVIYTRADHTRASDRSQDVRIPVSFGSGESGGDGSGASGDSDDAGSGAGALAQTGVTIAGYAGAALLLLGLGAAMMIASHRRRTPGSEGPGGKGPGGKGRGVIATVAIAALASGGLIAGPPPSAQAAELPATGGSLEWGVRTSFQNYVAGPIAEGEITTDGGASADSGQFHFPDAAGSVDPDTRVVELAFAGSMHFTGHDYGNGPLLDITLSNLRIAADGPSGAVVADLASRPFQGIDPDAPPPPVETHSDVEMVTLDLSGQDLTPDTDGTVTVTDAPAALTAEGSEAFAGFYPAGDAFDPVSFTVTVGAPPEAPAVTAHPADVTVDEGDDAVFTAEATGEPVPTVAWETSADGATWEAIDDATSGTLTLEDVSLDRDGTSYRAVFTNDAGDAATDAATLTVVDPDPGPDPVAVTVEPSTDLPATGAQVTVTGSGFAASSSGVYIGVGPADVTEQDDWFTNADYYTGVRWVQAGAGGIGEDGSFTSTLTFDAEFTSGDLEVDCTAVECGVFTFAAHGSPDRSQDTFTPVTFAGGEDPVWEPSIELVDEDGTPLADVPAEGAVVTVRGEGFDPDANLSTRPPVTPGEPTGVYVIFGDFDVTWQPSDGAPSSARRVIDQKWALPAVSLDQVVDEFPSQAAQLVELDADGGFEATLDIAPIDGPDGVLGVYTYAAGGAEPNAEQELFIPVKFANAGDPALTVTPVDDLQNGDDLEVAGTGFAPGRALYVAITPQGASGEGNPSPFSSSRRVSTAADGSFSVSIEDVQAQFTNENADVDCTDVTCHVASFSSPLESDNEVVDLHDDRSQDVFVPITFASDPGPDPDPDPDPDADGSVSVDEGALDWGVKESFRSYVTGPIAHGSIEVSGGATENADGTFRFADATGTVDPGAGTADLEFTGTVSFAGHDSGDGPLLELILTDPRLSVDGDSGVLVADVTSRSLEAGELVEYPDVEFAELDFTDVSLDVDADGLISVTAVPATLTEAGAPAFADFYESGEDLDPVSFTLGTSDVPPPGDDDDDPPTDDDSGQSSGNGSDSVTNTASTGGNLPTTGARWAMTALAGLTLIGAGAGISLVARRRRVVEIGS